jgi:hypothetical protein
LISIFFPNFFQLISKIIFLEHGARTRLPNATSNVRALIRSNTGYTCSFVFFKLKCNVSQCLFNKKIPKVIEDMLRFSFHHNRRMRCFVTLVFYVILKETFHFELSNFILVYTIFNTEQNDNSVKFVGLLYWRKITLPSNVHKSHESSYGNIRNDRSLRSIRNPVLN